MKKIVHSKVEEKEKRDISKLDNKIIDIFNERKIEKINAKIDFIFMNISVICE